MFRLLVFVICAVCMTSCKDTTYQNQQQEDVSISKKALVLEGIGKTYFEDYCTGCHRKGGVDNYLESAVKSNKYDFKYLRSFIPKEDSLIKAGDSQVLEINNWSGQQYSHHFHLNDKEIKAIIYYLKK